MDGNVSRRSLIAGAALTARGMLAADEAPAAKSRAIFVAVGHQGLRMISENGADWSQIQTGKEGEYFRAVAFGNGRHVAAGTFGGQNIFSSSADGVKWETTFK